MAKGYDSPWTTWKFLNRLGTGYSCSETQGKKWKFYTGDTTCVCGKAEETTTHMLQYTQLAHPYSLDNLITFNDIGKQYIKLWKKLYNDTTLMINYLITQNKNTPTRVPNTTLQQTSLPYITTVSNTVYNRTSWITQHALSSDHLLIITTINTRHDYRLQQKRRTFTNYKKADYTQYAQTTMLLYNHTSMLVWRCPSIR